MAIDLTATAVANGTVREANAADTVAADASGTLRRFFNMVDRSTFSSNIDASKAYVYDLSGEVLDARRYHTAVARGDSGAGLKNFGADRSWVVRREAFEDIWLHGRTFVYGAVNMAGMGAEGRFGPFCLVVADPTDPTPAALAVFPGDSAQRYTGPSGAVNRTAAVAEATAWHNRADLIVIERASTARQANQSDWPEVVCQPDRYFEVTRAGTLPIQAITEVRMREELLERLRELRAREMAGESLQPDERNEVRAYDAFRRWRRMHRMTITAVR